MRPCWCGEWCRDRCCELEPSAMQCCCCWRWCGNQSGRVLYPKPDTATRPAPSQESPPFRDRHLTPVLPVKSPRNFARAPAVSSPRCARGKRRDPAAERGSVLRFRGKDRPVPQYRTPRASVETSLERQNQAEVEADGSSQESLELGLCLRGHPSTPKPLQKPPHACTQSRGCGG